MMLSSSRPPSPKSCVGVHVYVGKNERTCAISTKDSPLTSRPIAKGFPKVVSSRKLGLGISSSSESSLLELLLEEELETDPRLCEGTINTRVTTTVN